MHPEKETDIEEQEKIELVLELNQESLQASAEVENETPPAKVQGKANPSVNKESSDLFLAQAEKSGSQGTNPGKRSRRFPMKRVCLTAYALIFSYLLLFFSMVTFNRLFGYSSMVIVDSQKHPYFIEQGRLMMQLDWLLFLKTILEHDWLTALSKMHPLFLIMTLPALAITLHVFINRNLKLWQKLLWTAGILIPSYYFWTPVLLPFYCFSQFKFMSRNTRVIGLASAALIAVLPSSPGWELWYSCVPLFIFTYFSVKEAWKNAE